MSAAEPDLDALVRSKFAVKDSYVLPGGEYEYRVAYGPEGKEKFVELDAALAPMGMAAWVRGAPEDCQLTLKKSQREPYAASRTAVALALFSIAVILLYSLFELQGDQLLSPQYPGSVAFAGYGATVVALVALRFAVHLRGAKKAGSQPNSSYLLPGIPWVTPSLPAIGFVSHQRVPALNRERYFDLMVLGPVALLAASVVLQVAGYLTAAASATQLNGCQAVNSLVQVCPSNSSIIQLLIGYVMGPLVPAAPAGHVLVSPLGDGASVGFVLASIAILPMASFDGGHLSNVLWGQGRARVATYLCVALLLALDTNELLYWGVAIAVLLVGGRPLELHFRDEVSKVAGKRQILYLALLVVALLALPIPHDIASLPLA